MLFVSLHRLNGSAGENSSGCLYSSSDPRFSPGDGRSEFAKACPTRGGCQPRVGSLSGRGCMSARVNLPPQTPHFHWECTIREDWPLPARRIFESSLPHIGHFIIRKLSSDKVQKFRVAPLPPTGNR